MSKSYSPWQPVLPCRSVLSQPTSYRPRLLLEGRPGSGQNSHLGPAVLHALEKFTVYTLDMAVLFGASVTAPEETCAKVRGKFSECTLMSDIIMKYVCLLAFKHNIMNNALKVTDSFFFCFFCSLVKFSVSLW